MYSAIYLVTLKKKKVLTKWQNHKRRKGWADRGTYVAKQKNISSYSLQRSCVQRWDPWGLKGFFLLKEKILKNPKTAPGGDT